MVLVLPQWTYRALVCSRHGSPVTSTAKARFRSRPPVWLGTAVAVAVVAGGVPLAFPALRYLDDPDPDLYLFVLGGGLFAGWLLHNILVKIIDAPDWGFCATCVAQRNRLVFAALACGVLFPISVCLYVPFVLPESLDEPSPPAVAVRWAVVLAPGFFAVAGSVLLAYARWARLAGGVANRDGTAVEFRRPAPEFADELTTPR